MRFNNPSQGGKFRNNNSKHCNITYIVMTQTWNTRKIILTPVDLVELCWREA